MGPQWHPAPRQAGSPRSLHSQPCGSHDPRSGARQPAGGHSRTAPFSTSAMSEPRDVLRQPRIGDRRQSRRRRMRRWAHFFGGWGRGAGEAPPRPSSMPIDVDGGSEEGGHEGVCRQQRSRALAHAGDERLLVGQCVPPGLAGDFLEPLHRPMTLRVAPDGGRPAGGLSNESVGPSLNLAPRVDAPACRLVRRVGPPETMGPSTSAPRTQKSPP